MAKRVLDVGNCDADHAAIRALIEGSFQATVVQADGPQDSLAALRAGGIDLVLVNRKLDADQSDGLDVIRQIKQHPDHSTTPCMLITNFEDHQQSAVEAGAEPGFGKRQLDDPATREKLSRFLT